MIYDFTFERYKKRILYEAASRAILGVDESAPPWIIRAQFIKLAKKYHPDTNGNTEDMFKDINTAYRILTGKEKNMEHISFITLSENDMREMLKKNRYQIENYHEWWVHHFT